MLAKSQLSADAQDAILQAEYVLVSPISIYEISQKVRLGKWHDMELLVHSLAELIDSENTATARIIPEVCLLAGQLPWEHRDPFDRIIAATAIVYEADLISADIAFDALAIRRVW
jgi:PIN domain nuclease of toxin-antitoxin system